MVIPLKKTTKDGTLYKRRAEVEQMLTEFDQLEPEMLTERCRDADGSMPFEVLIYYLRHSELKLKDKHIKAIFEAFYARLKAVLQKSLPDSGLSNASAVREEIVGQVMEMIAADRNNPQQDKMYYWETNFNHALQSLRDSILKKMGPTRNDPLLNATPLAYEEGEEVLPEVEIAAANFFNSNTSKLDDPAFRFWLMAAINELPKDEKRALGLLLQGMQVDSNDPKTMTIAKAMECTEKTVRNRLTRAYSKLRTVIEAEDM